MRDNDAIMAAVSSAESAVRTAIIQAAQAGANSKTLGCLVVSLSETECAAKNMGDRTDDAKQKLSEVLAALALSRP